MEELEKKVGVQSTKGKGSR